MKKRTFILCIVVILVLPVCSQTAIHKKVAEPKAPNPEDIEYYAKKRGLQAGATNVGLNLGVWGLDRYMFKYDFAYISARTIKRNFKHGFVWDNDRMGTNMFMHPYHGSLYFNSARSNGYNYRQSGLFAFGGSAMWEMFMENDYPSINDIVATPIGGMALGEIFYRVTDLILDDRKTGKSRFGLELASFIISPTRSFSRIISGDAWRKRSTSGKQFGVPDVSVEFSAGIRALELKDDILDRGTGLATEINIEYGDRFDADGKEPYDYFSLKAGLNIQKSQPILGQLNIVGRLTGIELADGKNHYVSLGVYQHFDYYDSDTISDVSHKTPYKFCSPASVGIGMVYKRKNGINWDIDAYAHLNGIILGGTLSDYYKVQDRNYNLASGFGSKTGFNLIYKKDMFAVSGTYEMYRMFTWKGYRQGTDVNHYNETLSVQGDVSQATLHAIGLRLDFKLKKQLYLTGIFNNYTRDTDYKYYEDVSSLTSEGRMMLTYKF